MGINLCNVYVISCLAIYPSIEWPEILKFSEEKQKVYDENINVTVWICYVT